MKSINKVGGIPPRENFNSVWDWLMNWELTLTDGSKVLLKDNIKSVTFKQTVHAPNTKKTNHTRRTSD